MPGTYFAPAFHVTVNGSRVAADVSANVMTLSVDNEPDTLDHFGLTLANPYPAMPWTHSTDADLFREGNTVTIELGYVDDLQPMFDGEITSINPSFPEGGTPTVQIEGYSRLHRLRGGAKTRTFQNVTDQEIARQIADDLGLRADVEQTGTRHPYVIQYNQTDLAFLVERARAIRFEVSVAGQTLSFRKVRNDRSKSYTLVWGQSLLSFSASMNTLRPVGEVVVRGYDLKTKKEIKGRAGPGDEDSTMGGSKSGADVAGTAFHRTVTEVRVDTPVASQEEADQLAHAIYNDRALNFLTGTAACIGLPDVRAGRVVELQGLGPRFSGHYYVTRSTHRIDGSGYRTTFSVKRNST